MPNEPESKAPLGIIAGGGDIPERVVKACIAQKRPIEVIFLDGITAPEVEALTRTRQLHIGQVGTAIKHFKKNNVKDVIMIGKVGRPKISALHLDFTGLKLLANLKKLPHAGDDEVFTAIIRFFEQAGFKVVGVESVLLEMLMPPGLQTKKDIDDDTWNDIRLGTKVVHDMGKLDVGQAAIIQGGQILGVEGAEGTDKLIERCAELHNEGPGGILVKMKKPQQDTRVDLPCIGISTIENAHKHKLRGIAAESSGTLLIDKEAVIERANALGVFLVGINPLEEVLNSSQ